MTDKSLTATVRDADMRVLATLTLGAAYEDFWSGRCTCAGKPVFAVIENGEHDFQNGVMNGVVFSRPYVSDGEVVHLIDIANSGWRVLIGSSIGAGPVPKPEMVQLLDSRTHDCIEKINEHANRAASRVIELMERVTRLQHQQSDRETHFDNMREAMKDDIGKVIASSSEVMKSVRESTDKLQSLKTWLASVEVRMGIVEATADHTLSLIGKRVALKSSPEFVMTAGAVASDGRVVCYWQVLPGMVNTLEIPALALEVVDNG